MNYLKGIVLFFGSSAFLHYRQLLWQRGLHCKSVKYFHITCSVLLHYLVNGNATDFSLGLSRLTNFMWKVPQTLHDWLTTIS